MHILENNQIKKRADVRIDLEDRGYQFGDGIYEVIRVYDGKPFLMDEHLNRLERSAREIQLTLPMTIERIKEKLLELLTLEQGNTCNIYLQVTRGVAPRSHALPDMNQALLTSYIIPSKRPYETLRTGIKAITTEDIRWLRCDIKSLNLLGNVLAKQKAVEHNCGEAILHRNGIVTEGSSSNFFIVNEETLRTHPANNLILHGISRAAVIRLAKEHGLKVDETAFRREDIYTADEAFLTGTTTEVCPVTHVDNRPISDGRPGAVTRQLQEAFEELISTS